MIQRYSGQNRIEWRTCVIFYQAGSFILLQPASFSNFVQVCWLKDVCYSIWYCELHRLTWLRITQNRGEGGGILYKGYKCMMNFDSKWFSLDHQLKELITNAYNAYERRWLYPQGYILLLGSEVNIGEVMPAATDQDQYELQYLSCLISYQVSTYQDELSFAPRSKCIVHVSSNVGTWSKTTSSFTLIPTYYQRSCWKQHKSKTSACFCFCMHSLCICNMNILWLFVNAILLKLATCLSGYKSIIVDPIALRKDKTLWSLTLLPSERTKLYGV